MSSTESKPAPASHRAARCFHSAASAVLIIFVVWGFHHFYLQGRQYPGRPITPPIRNLIILHGLSMAAWMVLSLVQPLLILGGRRRVHMMLGKVGAGIAAAVVVLGFMLGVQATRLTPPEAVIWGLNPRQFMSVPIISIMIFAGLVVAGILNRRKPGLHRPLMLLATLAALPAAVSRIDALSSLYIGTVWERLFGPFFGTIVIAVLLLAAKSLLAGRLDRVFAIGCAGLALSGAFIMWIARTGLWDAFAGLLLG